MTQRLREVHGEPAYWRPELETMSADDALELEGRLLRNQLASLVQRSPFYRRKLREAGVDAARIRVRADLADVPFTTKHELRASQEEQPPYGDYVGVEANSIVRVHGSSGTTGRPSWVGLTRRDAQGWAEMVARSLYATGVRERSVTAYAFSIGFFCGGPANIDAIQSIGATLVPVGTGASDRLVSAIQDLGVNHLLCTPSYAEYFAEYVRSRHGVDPRTLGVARLSVGGEPGGGVPAVRARIESDWDAKVFDAMGSADLAPVFLAECEEQAGMHFFGQRYLLPELIDPDTARVIPFEDGAEGELVVSHLDRECVPLLRFRTSDRVAVWTDPCPCGRTSFRLRCVGRTDDMLIVLGVNVFPSAVKDVVSAHRPATTGELIIELDKPGPKVEPPLRVLIEYGPGVPANALDALGARLTQELRDRLVVRADVRLVPPGTLPRSEMKAQLVRVVSGNSST